MTNSILIRDVIKSDLPILFEQQLDPDATAMAQKKPQFFYQTKLLTICQMVRKEMCLTV